jgi:hypothetical protein
MSARGWVYVITNKAMPGLVKVGFSMKDPDLRANELGNTGAPHSYVVEYEVMVRDPRNVEQRVHSSLSSVKEAKEWFRCTLKDAMDSIRSHVGSGMLLENVRNPAGLDESTSFPDKWTAQQSLAKAGKCHICTAPVKPSDGRCPKCFALIN